MPAMWPGPTCVSPAVACSAVGWRIAQGVEMGRPSVLEARADKTAGKVTGTWIGGSSVMVASGMMDD